jgi:hypothetical protein
MLVTCAALSCSAAQAHDTWFAPVDEGGALALATGNRFPVGDPDTDPAGVVQAGCDVASTARAGPVETGATPRPDRLARPFRVPAPSEPGACWAELRSFDITLSTKLVDVYLREVRPPPAVGERWAALQQRGIAWQESYRKFARVEFGGETVSPEQFRTLRLPRGMDLEIVATGDQPMRVGQRAGFRVLAKGQPLPGIAVELVTERHPLGIWARTDADGQVAWAVPFDGAWLVRTVLVEPDGAVRWRSRFATFAFFAR